MELRIPKDGLIASAGTGSIETCNSAQSDVEMGNPCQEGHDHLQRFT